MSEEPLYILCIVLFLIGTIHLYMNMQKAREGFLEKSTSVEGIGIGQASNSSDRAKALKNQVEHLKDTMNIGKYRTDYENIIINLDDIIGYEMLQTTVNLNTNADLDKQMADIEKMNKLNAARENLNSLMKWMDKQ